MTTTHRTAVYGDPMNPMPVTAAAYVNGVCLPVDGGLSARCR
ncbi:hypothetical protein PV396_12945 [Streptomyces sp. ME02-8801-2C]|nr:hypothetical protein [Streptomyces sp. ME02-8801-2C]MDX3452846.1 hypothetical protein [Streptomyces sp. ME02-8801-2C]